MRTRVAPVPLGCCPDAPRCQLCNPPPAVPSLELIRALVEHYDSKAGSSRPYFIGGPPPTDRQVGACGGREVAIRVRPDLLSKARAEALAGQGVVRVELDALTFSDRVLKECGRRYSSDYIRSMARGLQALGLEVGLVLAPGLPNTDHAAAVSDAREAVGLASVVRLHPLLVLSEARLREAHMDGRYEPLTLGEAITTCRAMMDVLEGNGVEVIRVGVQGTHDGVGRVVAGPAHGALRELVESRRTLDVLRERLRPHGPGASATLRCARCDEGRVRGLFNQHIRTLRSEFGLTRVEVVGEPSWPRGALEVEVLYANNGR